MVEVFKTNVQRISQAKKIVALLLEHFPDNRINFDLHDCDKVLRIEGKNFEVQHIIMLVNENGFICNVLE
jgi:hypothetical protein